MKLLTNKFFIICLCVALFFSVVPTVWLMLGRSDLIRSTVNTVAVPFRWVGSKISDGFKGFGSYFSSMDRLLKENEDLTRENESLRAEIYDLKRIEKENDNLKKYINLDSNYQNNKWIAAKVVATTDLVWTINCGTEAGIQAGRPVVSSSGAIGTVTEAGVGWAYVKPIWKSGVSISAVDVDTDCMGEVTSSTDLAIKGQCRFSGMEESAKMQVGDIVMTSGMGSSWPGNVVIGEILDVQYDAFSRVPVAVVQIAAFTNNPDVVLVLDGGS